MADHIPTHGTLRDEQHRSSLDEEASVDERPNVIIISEIKLLKYIFATVVLIGLICSVTVPIILTQRFMNDGNSDESLTKPSSNVSTSSSGPPSNSTATNSTSTNISTINVSYGPFKANIEFLSPRVIDGYASDEEFIEAIKNAANYNLGLAYQRNLQLLHNAKVPDTPSNINEDELIRPAPPAKLSSTVQEKSSIAQATNCLGANNQVKGIVEGDVIVSDGQYVYAGYGKYLVVFSASTGDVVKTIEMPAINVTSQASPMYAPEPVILKLILYGGRLLVAVQGYGDMHRKVSSTGIMQNILLWILSTHLRIYDTSSLLSSVSLSSEIGLVGTKDINGMLDSIVSVDENIHIVTTTEFNTGMFLDDSIALYNFEANITEYEYKQRIKKIAPDLGNDFASKLLQELKVDGVTPTITRINLWMKKVSEDGIAESTVNKGLLTMLLLVHSIDIKSLVKGHTLSASVSGSFVPSGVSVHRSSDRLIAAVIVYEYDRSAAALHESTALISFALDGASVRAQSIGIAPGTFYTFCPIDIAGDSLRVATTLRNYSWIITDDSAKQTAPSTNATVRPTTPLPFPEMENFISIFSLPSISDERFTGAMVAMRRVTITKRNEYINGFYFFGIIAVILIEELNVLSVLDLSDPANSKAITNVDISFKPRYLHSVNALNTFILVVGQDEFYGLDGLKLALVDISNPSVPNIAYQFSFQNVGNMTGYVDFFWDATRYSDGYLFLPVDMWSASVSSHDPYSLVFKVDVTSGVTELRQCRVIDKVIDLKDGKQNASDFSINNTSADIYPCNYTSGSLPRRSMVFDGKLLTTSNSDVVLTDLKSCDRLWSMRIGIAVPNGCRSPT